MAENTEKHENSNFGNAYNISGGLQEAIDYNERSLKEKYMIILVRRMP